MKAGRLTSGGLVLLFAKNDLNYARLGLAISKKHLPLATQRNLVKRLIREQFRHHRSGLVGVDIVVLSRAALASLERKQIWQELKQLFKKLHYRCSG